MSKTIQAGDLRRGDMFEMADGSVYETSGQADTAGPRQARLWCAHASEPLTFEPPLIELPPAQEVQLLNVAETEGHTRHDGFVANLFQSEMDRRNQDMMHGVYERQHLEQQEQRASDRARRPWWKKVLG